MRTLRGYRVLTLVLALALLATACGGGDSDDTTTTTAASSSDGGSDSGNETTTTTVAATTTTTEVSVSGDSDSTYCRRVRAADESDETPLDFSFFGKTPEELEAQFEANLEVFAEWVSIAPDDIKDAAQTVYNAYEAFVNRGNELLWDLEAMADDEVLNSGFDTPELDTASEVLDAYSRDVCGVDFTTIADPGGQAPPTSPGGGDDETDAVSILLGSFGLPVDFFPEEAIECMRTELGPEFEAKITPDYVLTAEDTALLFAAIDACELNIGG